MNAETSDRQWFCITANPNCQRRAEAGLIQRGYRVFYPTYRKWASHARTKVAKNYPLLGRYMFVAINDQSFGMVRTVDGVESFVSIAGRPVEISREWVEGRFLRWLDGEWDYVRQEACYFRDDADEEQVRVNPPPPIGARIRIMEGEFHDQLAKVLGRDSGKIVFVPQGQFKKYRTAVENVRAA